MDGLEALVSNVATSTFNAVKTLDNVAVYATKITSSFLKNVGNVLGSAVKSASQAITGAVNRVADWSAVYRHNLKTSVKRLGENAKANWAAGNTIPQQFVRDAMTNPISLLDGGAEANIVKGALGMEIKTIAKTGIQLGKSELKSIASFERQIVKHQSKLAEYIKDPLKFDNKGFLKNAPSDAVRQKIIQSRINHLNTEIQTFQNNIQKILNGQ